LQPAQRRDPGEVGRRPAADDDLEVGIGHAIDIERRVVAGVDHLQVRRQRPKALDRFGLDLRIEQQAHRITIAWRVVRRGRPHAGALQPVVDA
jgi:hypothetical protein